MIVKTKISASGIGVGDFIVFTVDTTNRKRLGYPVIGKGQECVGYVTSSDPPLRWSTFEATFTIIDSKLRSIKYYNCDIMSIDCHIKHES